MKGRKRERSRDKVIQQEVHKQKEKHDEDVTEIMIEGIPQSLSNEKVTEMCFVFGDILNIEFFRIEKKAFVAYKYSQSAQKALRKLNKGKKSLKVKPSQRKVEKLPEHAQDGNLIGKVVFVKFESNGIPNQNEILEALEKYGEVRRIFCKKEGRTFYAEFAEELPAYNLVSHPETSGFTVTNHKAVDLGYAFNKTKKAAVEHQPVVQQDIPTSEHETPNGINPNKHWYIYYDSNTERNFYFNPFFNQSVWELPEGAEIAQHITETKDEPVQEELPQEIVQEQVDDNSIYDDEAFNEDDLKEKLIWEKVKENQLKEWMKRPARQQVTDTRRDTAYIEGNYDYNIWFDKYLTDRKEEKEKIPATYKCNPSLDTGYTKADLQEKEGGAYFCLYFAKGCCSEGVNCRYYHRVPTLADAEKIENLRDVFGRSRFATALKDSGGVGTFSKECRTLFVSDIKAVNTPNPVKDMVRILYENFSPWGEIEDINYIEAKGLCFIRYNHRVCAEFAKEAMMRQSLVGEEILTVRWAYDDPNPMNKKKMDHERENRFVFASKQKEENLNKLKQRTGQNVLPNNDYYNYYNNANNPYSYSSGYGEITEGDDKTKEITKNCSKLAEAFKLMEENYEEDN